MGMLSSKIIATLYGIPLQLLPTWLLLFVRNNRRRTSTPALSRISKLPKMAEAAWASTRVMMGRENPKEHTNKTHRHDTGGGTACNDRGDMLP